MRILMLTDYFPPHSGGGVEVVVDQLSRGMVDRGHHVSVLTLRTRGGERREERCNLRITRVPAVDLTGIVGVQFAVSVLAIPALISQLRSFKPDLIHVHNLFFRNSEAAALVARFSSTPMLLTLHLGDMGGGPSAVKALTALYEKTVGRCIVRAADQITGVSEAVASHAGTLGANPASVQVIPNGVDTAVFSPAESVPEIPTVLAVGRLVPNKGMDTLVKSVPEVLSKVPEARFVIAGDGPMNSSLRKLATSLGVEDSVEFLGHRSDVPDLLRAASVFTRPSTLEGMPLTVLEAMATGLPVVATPVGGTPELITDGQNGYLTPVGDSQTLARAIVDILSDRERAAAMGQRNLTKVRDEYTWERVVDRTETLYCEMVGGRVDG
ncbi:MAG: GT4 family glycosyltransferase PelF [Chloroflexi bacterium]|nr:GT4 family glycosyltransferase PelF [Chloroflexota bacterium]